MSDRIEKEQVEQPVIDMRRPGNVVKYVRYRPTKNDISSAMSTSMPIAAMFMRNKILAWASLFTTVQAFLNEPAQRSKESQPAWLSVMFAIAAILTCYLDIFMPPKGPIVAAATKASASAVSAASTAAASGKSLTETIVEAVSAASETIVNSS